MYRRQLAAMIDELTGQRLGALADDTPLLQGGLALSSVEVLELVVRIEVELGVVVPSDALDVHFGTFGRLVHAVSARCG